MGIAVELGGRVVLGGQAWLVEQNRELAWAEKHVYKNRALAWVLGHYVEADNANQNGHIFELDELPEAQKTIPNSPINMLHRPHYIVGNFVASELLFPTQGEESAAEQHPIVDALGVVYRYYFPHEFKTIEAAHAEGSLFFSMEAVPEKVRCAGGCGQEFAYDGSVSKTYCDHLQVPGAQKVLRNPHFTGGALLVPPTAPGWRRANVTQLSELVRTRALEAEKAYNQIEREFPHLDPKVWERMMQSLLLSAGGVNA